MSARTALFIALGLVTLWFTIVLARALAARSRAGEHVAPTVAITIVSFIANFFDTLGIGSFATTTAMFRQWRRSDGSKRKGPSDSSSGMRRWGSQFAAWWARSMSIVPDEHIPGTLNVGYVLPTVVESYIFTQLVPVDAMTLILMIVASVLGAWLGAGVVSSWSKRRVQIGMGLALLTFALIKVMGQPQIGLLPPGGTALQLTGAKLLLGILGNFALGALMTMGIGLYAPCMILVSVLGMSPITAFPIMMGSCAFLMPAASVKFVRTGAYASRAMLAMILGGIPAVLIAAFIVKTIPLQTLTWVVIVVVTYTAINLLRAARRERVESAPPAVAIEPA